MSGILPEITEAQRVELRPGDALVLRFGNHEVSREDAVQVMAVVRQDLGRPDLPVLVLGRGQSAFVLSDEAASGT